MNDLIGGYKKSDIDEGDENKEIEEEKEKNKTVEGEKKWIGKKMNMKRKLMKQSIRM